MRYSAQAAAHSENRQRGLTLAVRASAFAPSQEEQTRRYQADYRKNTSRLLIMVTDVSRLQQLYEVYKKNQTHAEWRGLYTRDVSWVQGLDEQQFREPSNQERLWRLRGVSTIGPGE